MLNNGVTFKEEISEVKSYNSLLKTIEAMRIMESNSLKDSNFISFMKNNFDYLLNEYNPIKKIFEIHKWINRNIKYVDDVYDETLISPRLLIFIKKGDCDDFAMLLKTMLKFLNVNVNYILLGKKKNEYTHVANAYVMKNGSILYIDGILETSIFPYSYKFYKLM